MSSRDLSAFLRDMVDLHGGAKNLAKSLKVTTAAVEHSSATGRPSASIMARLGIGFAKSSGEYVMGALPEFWHVTEMPTSRRIAELEGQNAALRERIAELEAKARAGENEPPAPVLEAQPSAARVKRAYRRKAAPPTPVAEARVEIPPPESVTRFDVARVVGECGGTGKFSRRYKISEADVVAVIRNRAKPDSRFANILEN
jgi:hypothetical protein